MVTLENVPGRENTPMVCALAWLLYQQFHLSGPLGCLNQLRTCVLGLFILFISIEFLFSFFVETGFLCVALELVL